MNATFLTSTYATLDITVSTIEMKLFVSIIPGMNRKMSAIRARVSIAVTGLAFLYNMLVMVKSTVTFVLTVQRDNPTMRIIISSASLSTTKAVL
jgi:hypothetical protein